MTTAQFYLGATELSGWAPAHAPNHYGMLGNRVLMNDTHNITVTISLQFTSEYLRQDRRQVKGPTESV